VPRVGLVGGNEFRRESDAVDLALLALAGGSGAAVAILPTAATNENPEVVGENGIRHFTRLGARPEAVLVVDDESANDPALAERLAGFDLVYFTGGDPAYLLETLRGSLAWQAVLAVHERGGLVAGSSAGAMLLGEQLWRFDGWTPGLGLAPGLAVLPHHATLSRRWATAHMVGTLPKGVTLPVGVTLSGIDESTALLLPESEVVGAGSVTLYGAEGPVAYTAGARVPWRKLLE
jgi:cyanophycinase